MKVHVKLGLVSVMALTLVACGSDDDETSSASTGAPSSAGATTVAGAGTTAESGAGGDAIEEARALVEQYSAPPEAIDIPPLSKTPEPGLRIAYVGCDQTNCTEFGDVLEDAAAVLGWSVPRYEGPITPEAFNAGVTAALQEKPDGIIINNNLPPEAIQASTDAIAAAKIPYTVTAGNAEQQDPDPAKLFLQNQFGAQVAYPAHRLMAAWLTADSGGGAKVGYFHEEAIFILTDPQRVFEEEVARLCPDCELDDQLMALADIGTKLPSQVVSYVQSNPDVEYLFFPFGGSTLGIAPALEAAGLLDQVKIMTFGAALGNVEAIAAGDEAMSTAQDAIDSGFLAIDAFARYFVGDPPCCEIPDLPLQVIDANTIGTTFDPSVPFSSPDAEGNFRRIWGVTG